MACPSMQAAEARDQESVLWIDVTTLASWGRPPVGIVRVEAEFVRSMLDQSAPDVRFCLFAGSDLRFYEVPADECRKLVEGGYRRDAPAKGGPQDRDVAATSRPPARSHLAKTLIDSLLPPLLKKLARRLLFAVAAASSASADGKGRAEASLLPIERPASPHAMDGAPFVIPWCRVVPASFRKGDVYLSMGMDWSKKDPECIVRLRQEFGVKSVLVCHDLIPMKYPQLTVSATTRKSVPDMFRNFFVRATAQADGILCVSKATRRDVQEALREISREPPRLGVVRLGSTLPPVTTGEVSAEVNAILSAKSNFILYVSTIERRKNHETVCRAYTRLIDAGLRDLPLLVFVGMVGWGVKDFLADVRADPRIRDSIRLVGHVDDAGLAALYRAAYFTVFPSLYEGWGLPVAEALGFGKFVLASSAGSIPEVGGDLLEYIDPWDVPRWAERLRHYIDNPDAVRAREASIRQRYRPTAWEDTASAVYSFCKGLSKPAIVDCGQPDASKASRLAQGGEIET